MVKVEVGSRYEEEGISWRPVTIFIEEPVDTAMPSLDQLRMQIIVQVEVQDGEPIEAIEQRARSSAANHCERARSVLLS